MRPVRLEIEGLRSFRARQVIDFTGRDYIAVIGDTGAGKSSILEAMTFALFGRTTFSGQAHQELMNASSTSLRVVFTFDVGGDRWEATRTLRRSGKGVVGTGPVSLEHLAADGSVIEKLDRARDLTAKVEAVLGLDVEAFLRTVVLPQGQFSRLLVDDDQKQRSSVLRQIWRTDELTAAGEMADVALRDLGPLQGRVAQALAAEPEDPVSYLAALDAAAGRCASMLAEARARQTTATEAAQTLGASERETERADAVLVELSKWDAVTSARTVSELVVAAARSDRALREITVALDELDKAKAAIPGDEDGYQAAEITTFSLLLQQLPGLVRQREQATAAAVAAGTEMAELRSRVEAATRADRELQDRVAALTADGAALAAAAEAAAARHLAARAALDSARAARESARTARATAESAERSIGEETAALAGAGSALEKAQRHCTATREVLNAARRASAAAAAAHGLQAGDACPVCDRPLAEGWAAPTAPALDAGLKDHADAEDRLNAAKEAFIRVEGRVRGAQDAAQVAAGALARAVAAERAAADELEREFGQPVDPGRSDGALLADIDGRVERARAALRAHEDLSEGVRAAEVAQRAERARAEASLHAKQVEWAGIERRREEAIQAVGAHLDGLPLDLRPVGDDLVADIDRAVTLLTERRQVLDSREAERQRIGREAEQLRGRRQELEQESRIAVDEPASALWTAVVARVGVLERCAADLGAVAPPVAADRRPPISQLSALVEQVSAATTQLVVSAQVASASARTTAIHAAGVLRALADEIGLPADDDERVVAAIAVTVEDATFEERTARRAAEAFRSRLPALTALKGAATELDARVLALADLAAALRDGAFPKWLTLRRSRRLLVHASRLLSEITADRFAFADLDDAESQWFVFDRDHGQPRSPSSLSGGEKFVASLALALGMVEMMGRQGDRIGSLFLDEGFGALDRTNLDAAVEALASVAATGRMVAVITHLRAVAEQIDDVLSVTGEATGTRVEWLDASARSALSERELSVRGGLLE
ncbi:MAG: SMC family ATPase [Acidimicrobiales bacterium]